MTCKLSHCQYIHVIQLRINSDFLREVDINKFYNWFFVLPVQDHHKNTTVYGHIMGHIYNSDVNLSCVQQ